MNNQKFLKSVILNRFAITLTLVFVFVFGCQQPPKIDETIKVDITATAEPINPFIYGQFIEHLGKCIYGGIWAEMLEDRKFYIRLLSNSIRGELQPIRNGKPESTSF
jgi:hypothetical protein